jgi:hypothetical protein
MRLRLRSDCLPLLSPSQHLLLTYLTHLLHHLAQHEATTRMSPLALAIVIAPSLISGPDPLEDAAMCMKPGRSLPAAMLRNSDTTKKERGGGGGGGTIVGVLEMWIRDWPDVSGEGRKNEKAVCRCS